MKILVLADIHANWPALSALAALGESFDACLVAGDLVDYGADPAPCVDWVRENATAYVRGNHDHAVAQRVPARGGSGLKSLAAVTRPLHWRLLDPKRLSFLAKMPVTCRLELGGLRFFLVHGTPRDPLDEYLTNDARIWEKRLADIDADIVCVGHTHVPFHLDLGRLQVLNPGSLGQPRDGDPRGSYAVIHDGRVEFRRVQYNVDEAIDALRAAGIAGDPMDLADRLLRTGGLDEA
jgi:putative phosphoesterase